MNIRVFTFSLFLMLGLMACKKDDDGGSTTVEVRDRGEQQQIDNDSILGYLDTHYYNKAQLSAMDNPTINDIVISDTQEDGYEILLTDAMLHNTTYEETEYQYYVLTINEGGGENAPHFCDDVRVYYEGSTLENEVFDSRLLEPIVFDLVTVVKGWSLVMPLFKESAGYFENGDGTVSFDNPGLGVMFIPSGLAYFSNALEDVPAYSPMIFKFELLETEIADHDNDGVPSYKEDLNGDGYFNIDDDDTDDDGTPDFADEDDDNDGVLTINEDLNNDGDPTNDLNSDDQPLYLDPDSYESNLSQ